MPRATVNEEETETHDLKTLPDGFVKLRRLSYGEKLKRRAMVSRLTIESGKGKEFAGEMQMINEKATQFDFQFCVVDHNLEDEQGRQLNFQSVRDIQRLDPRIGEEIDQLISNMNNFEDEDEEEGNS